MKVLLVSPGSFHSNLYHGARALIDAGVSLTVLLKTQARLEVDGLTVMTRDPYRFSLRQAWELLAETDPDLTIIRRAPRLSRRIALAAIAQRRRCLAYDQQPYLIGHAAALRNRLMFQGRIMRMTPVRGLSNDAAADSAAYYLPFPVASLTSGRRRKWAPDDTIRILCVAKLAQPRKNHLMLLEVLEKLAARHRFTLTLAGSTENAKGASKTYLDRVRASAVSGQLAGRVAIEEDIPFEEMPPLYQRHDLFVMPSRKEPLGTAPVEAMGFGLPVIVTDECGSAGYLVEAASRGHDCGRIVPAGDRMALTAAILGFLENPPMLRRKGENALAWTRTEHGNERFVQRFFEMAARCEVIAPGCGNHA
jgi:glycosyltransferase involved in cell wall biosynthesis